MQNNNFENEGLDIESESLETSVGGQESERKSEGFFQDEEEATDPEKAEEKAEEETKEEPEEKAEENPFEYRNQQQYRPHIPFGFTPETYAEKRDIRRRSNYVAIPFIVMFLILLIWSSVFYFAASLFGITPQKAYQIISEPAVLQIAQIILSSVMFLIPFTLAAKIAGMRISELCAFEKPEKGTVLPFFLFGLGFCAFANISVSIASDIFSRFGVNYSVSSPESPSGFFGFALSVIATAIVPALVEEFACRGVIFGMLLKYGQGFALIATSIVFGVMHGNFEQMPFAFLVGLVLGYIRIKTNSIWVCVLVHGSNNLVSVLMEYLLSDVTMMAQNVIYTVFLMLCLLLAIFAILLISKSRKDCFTLEKRENACEEIQKYKWFFSSPAMIICLCLYFIQSVLYFFE